MTDSLVFMWRRWLGKGEEEGGGWRRWKVAKTLLIKWRHMRALMCHCGRTFSLLFKPFHLLLSCFPPIDPLPSASFFSVINFSVDMAFILTCASPLSFSLHLSLLYLFHSSVFVSVYLTPSSVIPSTLSCSVFTVSNWNSFLSLTSCVVYLLLFLFSIIYLIVFISLWLSDRPFPLSHGSVSIALLIFFPLETPLLLHYPQNWTDKTPLLLFLPSFLSFFDFL